MTASVVYAPAVALNLDFPVTVSFSTSSLSDSDSTCVGSILPRNMR